MDDPFAPKVAESVQLRFGAFVDASSGEQHEVVFLTLVAAGDGESPVTFVLSTDQATGLGRAILGGPAPG